RPLGGVIRRRPQMFDGDLTEEVVARGARRVADVYVVVGGAYRNTRTNAVAELDRVDDADAAVLGVDVRDVDDLDAVDFDDHRAGRVVHVRFRLDVRPSARGDYATN